MKDETHLMLDRAHEFLDSAASDLDADPPRPHAAYADARTAAELAGKVLLLDATGSYPKEHAIGGSLFQAGLIPPHTDPRALDRFLRDHTRARYGFLDQLEPEDAQDAIALARRLLQHAEQRVR